MMQSIGFNLIAVIFALVIGCIELAIVVLFILTLWRLYTALGIYIKEHEPEEDGADESEDEDKGLNEPEPAKKA